MKTNLAELDLIDVGNLTVGNARAPLRRLRVAANRPAVDLEAAQARFGEIIGSMMRDGIVPIILGGGHETAFAHYLGYAAAGIECGIINIDAHLDVRPFTQGAHSGSPFRQAMEHPSRPLKHGRYVVIGAQRHSVARAHADYVQAHGGRIYWQESNLTNERVLKIFSIELDRLADDAGAVMVSVDVDAFRQADVPGCSAPNPCGLNGALWPDLAILAGNHRSVRSLDVVEINPTFDRDQQTARWAAVGLRRFLVGAAE